MISQCQGDQSVPARRFVGIVQREGRTGVPRDYGVSEVGVGGYCLLSLFGSFFLAFFLLDPMI